MGQAKGVEGAAVDPSDGVLKYIESWRRVYPGTGAAKVPIYGKPVPLITILAALGGKRARRWRERMYDWGRRERQD